MLYTDKAVTFIVSNGEQTAEMAILLNRLTEDNLWTTRLYTRIQPVSGNGSTRWKALGVSERLWPSESAGKRNGYIGTLTGHLGNMVKGNGENGILLTGCWTVDVDTDVQDELTANATAMPRSLFQGALGIEASFRSTAPITVNKPTLNEIAEWLTDGPIVALGNGEPLDPWTVSPMSTAHVALPVTVTEPAPTSGYTLSNGDPFHTRVFRRINGVDITDVGFVRMQQDRRKTILLVGPGGTGKTSVLEAASDKLFTQVGNREMTTLSLYGRFEPDSTEGSGFGWFRSELVKSIHYAVDHPDERVTWLLDEAMQVPEEVQINLHPLLDHRRCLFIEEGPDKGTLHAPDNWSMAAASNPHEPGARLGRPFASRLKVFPYFTNMGVVERVIGPGFEPLITVAKAMETARRNRVVDWAPQTRHIVEVAEDIKFLGLEYGLSSLMNYCDAETGFCGSRDLEELQRIITETYNLGNLQRLAFE